MLDVTGDLWTYGADLRAITTNGVVNVRGLAVMGRGCALEAKKRYPALARWLGETLYAKGNHVHLYDIAAPLATFPVKDHWEDDAELSLIEQSAGELVALADARGYGRVVVPRPGCGNGGLLYEDVRPILAAVFDDRFHVITPV